MTTMIHVAWRYSFFALLFCVYTRLRNSSVAGLTSGLTAQTIYNKENEDRFISKKLRSSTKKTRYPSFRFFRGSVPVSKSAAETTRKRPESRWRDPEEWEKGCVVPPHVLRRR